MDTTQPNSESHGCVPAEAQVLYPVPPFSWLAPLWSYTCGVIASSATSWTTGNILLFLLGLLLVGPLLGTARRASEQIRVYRELAADPIRATDAPQKPGALIPYTLPGSAGGRLASWLGAASARLRQGEPELGTLLLQLVVSTIFSLTVAAELGWPTLALAATALVCTYVRSLGREHWAAQRPRSGAQGAASPMAVFLPILLTWLIGHATYASIRPESALVGACFALTLYGCSQVHRTGKGVLHLLLPQVVVVAYFTFVGQPVAAAGATLLASAQLLWAPLLQTSAGRAVYFRAIQLPLAASMLLSAWTLGYGP